MSSMQSMGEGTLSAKRKSLLFVLLFAIAFLAYVNTFHNDFVWDDRYLLSENPYIRDVNNIPSFFMTSKTQASYDMKVYRPLRQAMFAAEYRIFGLNSWGYHLQNVLLHSLNCLLLFFLLRHLRLGTPLSFFAATIFSVHPVNTEAVASITGRTDVLFLCFYLAGLLFAVKSRQNARRGLYFIGAVVAYALSLLSKEMAVSFPLVVLLIDRYLDQREKGKIGGRLPLYLLLFALTVLYLLVRTRAIGEVGAAEYYGDSFWTTMAAQAAVVLWYIKLFFIPYPLSARYDIFLPGSLLNGYTIVLLLLITCLITATAVAFFRKRFPLPLLGGWWFIVTLLPVSNIVPIRAAMMAERYLYLPIIGLLILVFSVFTGLTASRFSRTTMPALACYAVVLSVFFVLTLLRNEVWENDLALFEDTEAKAPDSLVVHWNLFDEYQKRGDGEKAAAEYAEMKRINEKTAREHLAIARKYFTEGKRADAERLARKALRTKPDLEEASDFLMELEKDRAIH